MSNAEQSSFAAIADEFKPHLTIGGAWVYVEKALAPATAGRFYCPCCYSNESISELEPTKKGLRHACRECGNEFITREKFAEGDFGFWENYLARRYLLARPLIRLTRKTIRQNLRLKVWGCEAGKVFFVRLATILFRLHRHLHGRIALFWRWTFSCLSLSRRFSDAARYYRNGLVFLYASKVSLMVGPKT